jgi:hypothetical protein
MKNRCAGLVVVLFSLVVFGVANAEIEFNGVLDPKLFVTRIDSVKLTSPDMTILTPGWGSDSLPTGLDTFTFTGVTSWPASINVYWTYIDHGYITIVNPKPDSWYHLWFGIIEAMVMFWGDYGGVDESEPTNAYLSRLTVSPSVVTGQMTVRLQPVGTGRQVVEIHDAVGNVIRSLDCTAGTDGIATATWNSEDEFGRLVPEGVYFCRYTAADIVAVRKVLVTH